METDKKKVQPVLSNRQVKKKNVEKAKKLKKKKLGRLRGKEAKEKEAGPS